MISFPKQSIRSFALLLLVQKAIDKDLQFNHIGQTIIVNPSKLEPPFIGNEFNDFLRAMQSEIKDPALWPDGALKIEFEAASCIVDRKTKSGWLEGRAVGRCGDTELSGRGIYFSCSREYVKISSEVSIVSSDIKFEGVRL